MTMSHATRAQPTKYDMRVNKPYQIDFQNTASGKRLSNTKRRVRFRFGFSNAEAFAQGLSGTECRGEEHEVTVVWSLTSGKRLVLFDNEEVHFSVGNRTEGSFETTWTIVGGHIMKLIAHAAPPLFPTPGFRQFDLLLDGFSFFDMPRIYELGKTKNGGLSRSSAAAVVPVASSSPPQPSYSPSPDYASSRSLPEEDYHHSSVHFAEPSPPAATTPPRRSASAPVVTDLLEETPTEDYLDTSLAAASTPPQNDQFAPVSPPAVEQPSPAQSFALASNQIMSAYASPAPAPALPNEPHSSSSSSNALVVSTQPQPYHQAPAAVATAPPVDQSFYNQQQPQTPETPVYGQPQYQPPPAAAPYYATASPEQQQHYSTYATAAPSSTAPPDAVAVVTPEPAPTAPAAAAAPSVRLTMAPLNEYELQAAADQPELSELERAMKNLVNFDDISEVKESPQLVKAKQQKELAIKTKPISKPLAPTKADWSVGENACLSDIRKHAQPKASPQKEIMRTHAFDPAAAQAGMMVLYGSTPSMSGNGGFGAGMMMQQPQPQPGYYHQPQHAQQPILYPQQQQAPAPQPMYQPPPQPAAVMSRAY